jgi:hypothetical protein
MTRAAQQVLQSFKALDEADKHEVLVRLLRVPLESEYGTLSDEELRFAADQLFLEMDRGEAT